MTDVIVIISVNAVHQVSADKVLGWHHYSTTLLPCLSPRRDVTDAKDESLDTETDVTVVKRDVIQVLSTAAELSTTKHGIIYYFLSCHHHLHYPQLQ